MWIVRRCGFWKRQLRDRLDQIDDAKHETYPFDWHLRDGDGVVGGDAAVAGAPGYGIGCGCIPANERPARRIEYSGHGAVCGEQSAAAAGSGGGWECDLAGQC